MKLATAYGPVEAMELGGADSPGHAVLLHAAGSSPRALMGISGLLGRHDFRSLALHVPQTVTHAAAHPLQQQIDAARAALSEPGAPRLVFGHSFGGLVALLAALDDDRSEEAQTTRPDALILYEPIVLALLNDTDPADASARAWDRALIDAIAAGVEQGTPEPAIAAFIEAYNEVAWPALPEKARAAIVAAAPAMQDLTQAVHHLPLDRSALRRLDIPVLVLHGTRSPDVARRMAERLAEQLPRATLSVIVDAGHMAPALAPDRLAPAIAAFLDGLGAARA